jgi:4-amino-4-deoxy-L-arabinose transferase-like glycosyltransferase
MNRKPIKSLFLNGKILTYPPPEAAPAPAPGNRRVLALVVLIALILRLSVTLAPNFEGLMDADHRHAWEQGNVAEALVAGRGFGSALMSNQKSAIMPPVFPLIVAASYKVFGVHTAASIYAVHAFDCLLSALACIPIFLMARRSFGERVAWWAVWGWAFSPYGIYFAAAWAWSTHLLLLCLCWLLVLVQHMEHSPRLALWAGFGLLAGFAGLTEPSVLVVIPFLLVLAGWRLRRDGKRWFVPACVAGVVMVAAISPWMIRNALVFHRFIPMRDSMGLELWMGNNGYDLRWTSDDLHPLHDPQELAAYNSMGELAYMNWKSQQAKAYIHDHPGWYAWMSLRRAVYIWSGYWSFDRDYLALEPADPANIPFATCLTLLGLLGIMMAWRDTPFEVIRYAGVLFLFPLIYYFNHPEPYHLRAVDPLLVILGSQAILMVRERVRMRSRGRRLLSVADRVQVPAMD